MSLLRSPNGGGIGVSQRLSGSQPNIATATDVDSNQITFRNKRKARNADEDIMHELVDIKKQMADMMSLIASSTTAQTESINKLCQEVNAIKTQVYSISNNMECLTIEQDKLKTDILKLSDKTVEVDTKIQIVEKDLSAFKSSGGQISTKPFSYNTLITECRERSNRAKNIIIVGIQEPKSENLAERVDHDKREVQKIISLIITDCPEPEKILRLGKYQQDKVRLVKACFKSDETAKSILRNKSKVISTGFKIYADETPYQRATFLKLKKELEDRRTNGEMNLTIKYVKGEPTIVESKNCLPASTSRQAVPMS